MADERGVLRRVVWPNVFPGLILFRCFRMSIGLPVLFLATLGTLLMPLGPWALETAFPRTTVADVVVNEVPPQVPSPARTVVVTPAGNWMSFPWPPLGVLRNLTSLVQPFKSLFDPNATMGELLRSLCIAVWYLVVWALFGGAITRIAIVQLGRNERISLRQSLRHVLPKYGWYATAPLFPLLGIAFIAVPLMILGLVMRLNVGIFVAGVVWPLVLIAGFVMAVLATELVCGWLLMWPTISAEPASDSFQAFSNSFSFTFQRPIQYFFYALMAVLIGGLGGLFVEVFAHALIVLNYWAISFGLGQERLQALLSGQLNEVWSARAGLNLIRLGDGLVVLVARAYYFSFLFCAMSAIYLLLRREVDQTDFDEVHMPEESAQFALPPLRPGPLGVPEVDEPPPRTSEATSE